MIDTLSQAAEEWYGIKAVESDLEKLQTYLHKTYGGESPDILKKVFLSGEAAGFLTVNETYFFREPAHFAFLQNYLASFKKPAIHICSAAVATGCEAYSIAMMIETYNKIAEIPLSYHIDAFDLNPKVIDTACQGVYSERAMREDGSCYRYMAEPYFQKTETGYIVNTYIKRNISFFVHNLMNKLPGTSYDIIFFRNAFIYFTPQNRDRILFNLSAALNEGGILIVGVSETAGVLYGDLEEKNCNDVFYFQKAAK